MLPFARVRHALPALLAALVWTSGCASAPPSNSFPLNYLIAGGDEDTENLYLSVVRVNVPDNGACSGVLAGPHLVLTAAHCFCFPGPGTLGANKIYSITRPEHENEVALQCHQRAEISTVLYGAKDSTSPPKVVPFDGPIRIQIHEGYRFQTDVDATVVRSEMDLAAVYLGGEFEGVRRDADISDREAQVAEFLVAVGYGPTGKQKAGTRYFGSAKILDVESPSKTDKVFAFGRTGVPFREVYALKGDSGGPCFREDSEGRRWLIGIMSHGAELKGSRITFFTSAFHHREWINLQQDLSEKFAKTR